MDEEIMIQITRDYTIKEISNVELLKHFMLMCGWQHSWPNAPDFEEVKKQILIRMQKEGAQK